MEGNDVLQTVINTCNRYGIDWRQCPSYKELTQSDIDRSRLMKDNRFRTEVAEEIRLWANQWSLKETGKELFPKSFVSITKQQPQYDNSWKNIAGKLSETKLRKIVAESVKKVLKEQADCESARKALSVFGIVPVDVEGGRMWLSQENGQYYWEVSKALSELDLSYLDEKYTYNYGAN